MSAKGDHGEQALGYVEEEVTSRLGGGWEFADTVYSRSVLVNPIWAWQAAPRYFILPVLATVVDAPEAKLLEFVDSMLGEAPPRGSSPK